MATAPVIEEPGTALAPVQNAAAAVVLFDSAKFDAFYAKLKADVEAVPVDLTTKKGRDAIASVSAKVRSEKSSIDKDRLRLTKEWRDMTSQVNGAWNTIKEQLDTLAVEARAPLTEWEAAEKERAEFCASVIASFKSGAVVTMDDTAETVRARGLAAWEVLIKPETFGDMWDEAQAAKDHAVAVLKAALLRLEKEEADRAELAALRAANEERERIEAERIATERAAQEAAERAQAEQERQKAAQKAEADRMESVRQAAAARAQREAEAAAEAERKRVQREHEAALAAERQKVADAERAAQAERDRIAREEQDRQAEADRVAAEQAKREASQKHRSAVMKAAKEAIMTCGVDEETAKKVVLLIAAKEVPNVRLEF